ncbi:MAG: GNAT family N-acetyltransferase [Actinobacteria bacterium]|nr:MAG: GNAT family N-acetyltransferase [Actinomycetota bacterium]
MSDDLARAYAFLERGDMVGERTEPSSVGTAFFDDKLPRRLDSNFLRVEREADGETVRAEAERLGRRAIFIPESELGERLVPFFQERGWRVNRVVVMAQRREPDREPAPIEVVEVEEQALRPARQQVVSGQPWAKKKVMDQLFAGKHRIAERMTVRFFAVVVDGEPVSYTDVYYDETGAQIEDVGTLHEHRGRGYATAVVLHAIAEARRGGAEFVCLVADYEDWPKELYKRLGFDELGYYVKLINPNV